MKFKLAIPVALAALGLVIMAPAAHAATVKQVRQADFVPALSDTRTKGSYEFLREGIHLKTTENDAGVTPNQSKVAEYWAIGGALPTSGSLEWHGTTNQPGAQAVVDFDGNGTVDGILVGEPAFYQDRWWANNQANAFIAADTGNTAPGPADGYAHSGTLGAWKAAYPNAVLVAGGFSMGSGVIGDGVLRAVTFGDTTYEFTDTPAVVTKDVTGTATSKVKKNLIAKLKLKSDALPAGATQGKALSWRIVVDGKTVASFGQNAGHVSKLVYAFQKDTGTHKVVVFKNDVKVAKVKVKTNKA